MPTKINISIPQPCHENWEAMTVVDKGKFCNSCQKKVTDVTSSSDREIINAFEKNNNLCGRFLDTQFNRDLVKPKEKSTLWIAVTTSIISLMGLNKISAQEKPKTEQTDKKVLDNTSKSENNEIEISGIITDSINPIAAANIFVKGTQISAQSDLDGKFSIKAKEGDILVISLIGYSDVQYTVGKENNISINLSPRLSVTTMGIVITLKKRTFFGRLFHKSKYRSD